MITPLKYFCAFVLLWSSLLVSFNYIIDPIQYYRKSDSPVFVKNQRYQIPGLIKNYDRDTIIIGTSHSENFSPAYLDAKMDTNTLNLAISGSSVQEQYQVAAMALRQGKIKNIIWEFNYRSFRGVNPNLVSGGLFPIHLYNEIYKTHFYYLYSVDTLWMSIKNLFKLGPKKLEGLNSWAQSQANKFDGNHVRNHYCQRVKQSLTRKVKKNQKPLISVYIKNIDLILNNLVSKYPDVNFIIFIPPLSYYNYLLSSEHERFNEFRKVLYAKKNRFPNIKILDFATDLDSIGNAKNYKDVEHYSLRISNKILDQVSSNQELIAEHDIDRETERFNKFLAVKRQLIPECM